MEHDKTLSQIARGLAWIGAAFLVASAAVIVWAVFRTVGVDDLLVALTVAGLGLGLPAIVAFVVAWILNSLGGSAAEDEDFAVDEGEARSLRAPLQTLAWGYAVAVLACVAAWGLRAALDPLLGQRVIYAPLLLAVAFAAWFGGLGPAVFATLLGVGISWFGYLGPRGSFDALAIAEAVQLGLYGAAALCIGGIASALRASRERAQTLAREVLARENGLERTRAELASERDRFQVTLQAIADAVIATDAQGSVTFANDGAAALTGWPATEAIGRPLAKVFRTLDEHTRRDSAISLDVGEPDPTAGKLLVARDGTERSVASKVSAIRDRGGASGGFVLVFHDTTKSRRAQAALEESEARFRVMADQTPVPLWMSDTSRGYVYLNRAWLAFTGRTYDAEQGDGWAEGLHPEDFCPRQAAYRAAFDARKSFTLEYRLRRHDGEYRWIIDHGAPRFDGAGNFAGYIGVCLDVTERKEAAATRGSLERQTAFLAALAHELRNRLAPIRSSIELLQRMPRTDLRAAHAQDVIERNCARLAALVDDLRDWSRADDAAAQPNPPDGAALPDSGPRPAAFRTGGDAGGKPAMRVLIVDDDADAADAIGTLLTLDGFAVATVGDPADALERAVAFDPDVILLDIGLPGMSGYELARKLHAHPVVIRAKLIALTGYGKPSDPRQAQAAGFDSYIVKPVDVDRLRVHIDAMLG